MFNNNNSDGVNALYALLMILVFWVIVFIIAIAAGQLYG